VVSEIERTLEMFRLIVVGSIPSPLLGPAGNREFLVAAKML
jgi:predicted rRNA methylase YqxC with S4 and FtsJ domains